jgi:hypothetical protein
VALFAHVVGVLGLFMAIGIEMMALICMRRARTVAQLCDWTTATHAMDAVHPVSALLILVPGLYMMLTVWGWGMAWTDVALVLTLTLSALGPAISGRRLTAIYKAARTAPDGPLPASLVRQVHDPVLRMSLQTMAALAVGIVFLMTTKPGWAWSLGAIVVAGIVGVASAQAAPSTAAAPEAASSADSARGHRD